MIFPTLAPTVTIRQKQLDKYLTDHANTTVGCKIKDVRNLLSLTVDGAPELLSERANRGEH